jgi:hypothetical protein
VLKGSQALKEAGYVMQSYAGLKQKLLVEGILSESGNGYSFTKPYAFQSPSAAAAVILDRNSNGRREWRHVGSKVSYHEWQEQKASRDL